MPTNKNINDLLKNKGPAALRQTIQPVNIIQSALQKTERENRTEDTPERTEEKPTEEVIAQSPSELPIEKASEETNEEIITEKGSDKTVDNIASDLSIDNFEGETPEEKENEQTVSKKRASSSPQKTERKERTKKPRIYSERDIRALLANDKRETVRYSFEVYADQKADIQQVCDLYEEATGEKLSASRLLREVLDSFLPGALKAFDQDDR